MICVATCVLNCTREYHASLLGTVKVCHPAGPAWRHNTLSPNYFRSSTPTNQQKLMKKNVENTNGIKIIPGYFYLLHRVFIIVLVILYTPFFTFQLSFWKKTTTICHTIEFVAVYFTHERVENFSEWNLQVTQIRLTILNVKSLRVSRPEFSWKYFLVQFTNL